MINETQSDYNMELQRQAWEVDVEHQKEEVMEKFLEFCIRGEWFIVNRKGEMTQSTKNPQFSEDWELLGVSYHHWRQGIDCYVKELFEKPELMVKGRVWDLDHGSVRLWSGQYNGKLPRVTAAHTKQKKKKGLK